MNRQLIYQSTGGRCFYCGCLLDEDNFHIDHVIPKALGGTDYRNVVPACPDCNMSKGTLSIEEFRKKKRKGYYKIKQPKKHREKFPLLLTYSQIRVII